MESGNELEWRFFYKMLLHVLMGASECKFFPTQRDDGYYCGELGGKFGLVPSNFITDFETMSREDSSPTIPNSDTPSIDGHTPSPDQ